MVLGLKDKGYNVNSASQPVWLQLALNNPQLTGFTINGQLITKTTKKAAIAIQLPNTNMITSGDMGQIAMIDVFDGKNAEERRAYACFGVNAKRYIYNIKVTSMEPINYNGFNIKLNVSLGNMQESMWRV